MGVVAVNALVKTCKASCKGKSITAGNSELNPSGFKASFCPFYISHKRFLIDSPRQTECHEISPTGISRKTLYHIPRLAATG